MATAAAASPPALPPPPPQEEVVWQQRLISLMKRADTTASAADRIARAKASDLSAAAFTDQYLLANKPVLISGLIDEWKGARRWVQYIPYALASASPTATTAPSTPSVVTPARTKDSKSSAAAPVAAPVTATKPVAPFQRSTLETEHRITLKPRKKDSDSTTTGTPTATDSAAAAAGTPAAPAPPAAPVIVSEMVDSWLRPTQLLPIPITCDCQCKICSLTHPSGSGSGSGASTSATPLLSCCRARPDFNFLIREFGGAPSAPAFIPVAHCAERSYSDQKRELIPLALYFSEWRTGRYDSLEQSKYAKDWHFRREFPHYPLYDCPPHFSEDWLNLFCDHYNTGSTSAPPTTTTPAADSKSKLSSSSSTAAVADLKSLPESTAVAVAAKITESQSSSPSTSSSGGSGGGGGASTQTSSGQTALRDDYRFVYAGPAQSWTPLHRDVFASYSWSVNLCGRKLWLLFPPAVCEHLFDTRGNLCYNILDVIDLIPPTAAGGGGDGKKSIIVKASGAALADGEPPSEYPRLVDALESMVVVIQNAGDTIYVPSGWYHQVHNLDDVISINHNWLNGACVDKMHAHLNKEMTEVRQALTGFQFTSDLENVSIDDSADGSSTGSTGSGGGAGGSRIDMETETQIQTVMKANAGMNCDEFYRFCTFHALRIIHLLLSADPTDATQTHATRMYRLSLMKLSKILVALQTLPFIRSEFHAQKLLAQRTRELSEAHSARAALQHKQIELARASKQDKSKAAAKQKAAKKAAKKTGGAVTAADTKAPAPVTIDAKAAPPPAPAPTLLPVPTGPFIAPAFDSLLRSDITTSIDLALKTFQSRSAPPTTNK